MTFFNVGRDKKAWTAEIRELEHGALYRQVKANGNIMSSDVDFLLDDEAKHGTVIVDCFRAVGEFTWL